MTTIRKLWSIVRGHRSRFAPGGPASCMPADTARRGAISDFEPAPIPEPDLPLLLASGAELAQAARALGRTPALAVMQIDDLPELELVFGRRGVGRVIEAVMSGLTRAAAGHGLVVRTAADTFALVMPGGGAGAAIAAVQARFGKPCTIEIRFGREEILVVPDVMVHPLGPQDSVGQVYEELCRYIAKARRHGPRAQDCGSQRAACDSAPVRPPAAAVARERAPQYTPPLPATIPMPLGLR